MYKRLISLPKDKSFFLFGQRGTGKSYLLKQLYSKDALFINLLDTKTYRLLLNSPWRLREIVMGRAKNQRIVVIDEIQKVPALLDEVHLLIEENKIQFALTGSSARKLKKSGVNLLAGRAVNYRLYPLTHIEQTKDFNLDLALQWGTLPMIVNANSKQEKEDYLYSYVDTYLKEEIILEQVVRNIEPFSRFLEIASQMDSNQINYENIAKDTKISAVSIKSYFQILEDTLLGFILPAYHTSIRKRQKQSPKFYFHDIGIIRALRQDLSAPVIKNSFEYGILFENFIINEIIRLNEYKRTKFKFSYLKIDEKQEIDLIIERSQKSPILIEIKSKELIDERDLKALNNLSSSFEKPILICLSNDPVRKKIGDILVLHWREGIQEIFEHA